MRFATPIILILLIAFGVQAVGCAQSAPARKTAPRSAHHADFFNQHPNGQTDAGAIARIAPTTTSHMGAKFIPGRSVPYDNMSLPLVSPDARFIATQTRVGPDWPTILAEGGATVPIATRIEVYRLPADPDAPIEFVAELSEPALLGRSYDDGGFLVEAPQQDGSRWIGYVSWTTGQIDWLVADEHVNAFAALGPDGRLAWSRRAVDAPKDDQFDLVIRRASGDWILEGERESWLMPTWSWRGDGLFALSLSQGHLEAVHAVAESEPAFRQSRLRISLATEAHVFSAYQTIGAQVSAPPAQFLRTAGSGQRTAAREQFVFFHPSMMRMAVWRPTSAGTGGRASFAVLDSLSYAAVIHDDDHAIVSTERALLWRHIQRERDRSDLLAGMHVPRATHGDWPYVLLSPGQGEVAVIPMRPLTPDELALR